MNVQGTLAFEQRCRDLAGERNECIEEHIWSWADLQEHEAHANNAYQEAIYDEMTGRILKRENVLVVRMEELEMEVWEVVSLRECVRRAQRRLIRAYGWM